MMTCLVLHCPITGDKNFVIDKINKEDSHCYLLCLLHKKPFNIISVDYDVTMRMNEQTHCDPFYNLRSQKSP